MVVDDLPVFDAEDCIQRGPFSDVAEVQTVTMLD